MASDDMHVTGTLVWYYYICQRQVWLMAHQVNPDEDNPSIDLGRFLHEHVYEREKKEISLPGMRLDVLSEKDGRLVVGEIKKSMRGEKSARMQLLFYLDELDRAGVSAVGELRFPEQRKRERVTLDEASHTELDRARRDIFRIMYLSEPPAPEKIRYCRGCGYAELCWS
ncbi:MAG: CRISPR-associated protein Cas4 [Clostridia bacterium]|nr:CRISPR-associated protein Cas4 [Clostridia bacterium]